MRRLLRIAVSLLAVFATYGAYAVLAVPMIDPQATLKLRETEKEYDAPPPPPKPNDPMAMWFPDPRGFERKRPKMLRNDRGILLFKDYDSQNLGPGKIRLHPLSMVFLRDDPSLSEAARNRQAIVLQAPAGAVLRFDRKFNIRRGNLGTLHGGTILNDVIIHSQGKSPGPEDDLRIETSDVRLSETTIWTNGAVHFEYGQNRGSGRGLKIELLPDDERGSSELGRVKSLTLLKEVELDLVVKEGAKGRSPDRRRWGGGSPSPTREFAPEVPIVVRQGAPVTVRCNGTFHLDALKNLATFDQQVVVRRQHPTGPPDTLTCHRLALYLQPREKPARDPSASSGTTQEDSGPSAKLEIRRMIALGEPRGKRAELNAPGSAYAKGQRLEYDVQTRSVSLVDAEKVIFRQQENQIQARELHYHPGLEGRLGRFRAEGQGSLDWAVGDLQRDSASPRPAKRGGAAAEPPRRFKASWTRALRTFRHIDKQTKKDRQVIELIGGAQAEVTGMGQLGAEEIHAWLFEHPIPGTATVDQNGRRKQKHELIPDVMRAKTGVTINSPQVTGRTEMLEVFVRQLPVDSDAVPAAEVPRHSAVMPAGFVSNGTPGHAPSAGIAADRFPRRPLPPPVSVSSAPSSAPGSTPPVSTPPVSTPAPPQRRFDVAGQRIQVQMLQIGRRAQVSQVDIFTNARVLETQTAKPNERPLLVLGDFVQVTGAEGKQAAIKVQGNKKRPGHVEGRGLSLTGDTVNLDQGKNQVWIDGPGVMTLISERDLEGKPLAQAQPLEIHWQGGMQFDGLRAVFRSTPNSVILARRQHETLETKTLEAVFSRRVDFAKAGEQPSGGQRPEVDRIFCRGGVFVKRREFDASGPTSYEEMKALDLSIDQLSGDILANGPGWVTRWYLKREGDAEFPGLPTRTAMAPRPIAPRPGSPHVTRRTTDKPALNYLKVKFELALQGNKHKKVMTFRDQVQAIHTPVQKWGDTVDPNRVEQLGERGVVLTCDQLQLTELHGPGQRKWFEAVAAGNTVAEGQTFTAKAQQIQYTQAKDQLVLLGTDRSPAKLWRQPAVGAPRSHLAARKIEYWRTANRIKINKGQYGEVREMPASHRGRPSAPPR